MATAVNVAIGLWVLTALAGLVTGSVLLALFARDRLRARFVARRERDNLVAQAEHVVRLGR